MVSNNWSPADHKYIQVPVTTCSLAVFLTQKSHKLLTFSAAAELHGELFVHIPGEVENILFLLLGSACVATTPTSSIIVA